MEAIAIAFGSFGRALARWAETHRATITVRTQCRLYRDAKLDVGGMILRVTREGASWTENRITTTMVDVERSIACVGEWTIDASISG